MEEWRAIEGFEGKYEVSNTGKVRSLNYKRTGEVKEKSTRKNNGGYVIVSLFLNGRQFDKLVHRLVATAFIPNPNNLPQVNHIDCCKENNNSYNLEWCNESQNMRHAFANGRMDACIKAATEGVKRLDPYRELQKKQIVSINMKTGEALHHESINRAIGDLGISSTKEVISILQKKYRTTNGYTFVYEKDFIEDEIPEIIREAEEFRARARKKRGMMNAKKIVAIRKTDGVEVIYDSIADAARALDAKASNISIVIKNGKGTVKGYTFRLLEEQRG